MQDSGWVPARWDCQKPSKSNWVHLSYTNQVPTPLVRVGISPAGLKEMGDVSVLWACT